MTNAAAGPAAVRGEPRHGLDQLISELYSLRVRGASFRARAAGTPEQTPALLQAALDELDDLLAELRATADQLRSWHPPADRGFEAARPGSPRYRELFDWAPNAYLETDLDGTIRLANHAAEELLEAAAEGLHGAPFPAYVPLLDRQPFRTRLSSLGRTDGSVQAWSLRLRSRTSVERVVDARLRTIMPSGRVEPAVWWSLHPRPAATASTGWPPATDDALPGDAEVVLGQLVTAAALLFRAAGAGVTLVDEHGVPRWVTATDTRARAFEVAQAELGEGPCIDALHQSDVVWSADVASDPRWPALGELVAGHGIGAAVCAPLVLDGKPVGSFNVFLGQPLGWAAEDAMVAEALAGITVRLLHLSADLQQQHTLADQLGEALKGRVVIEQAKGVLMASHRLRPEDAWARLRAMARSEGRKAAEVAAEIVQGRVLEPAADGDRPPHRA